MRHLFSCGGVQLLLHAVLVVERFRVECSCIAVLLRPLAVEVKCNIARRLLLLGNPYGRGKRAVLKAEVVVPFQLPCGRGCLSGVVRMVYEKWMPFEQECGVAHTRFHFGVQLAFRPGGKAVFHLRIPNGGYFAVYIFFCGIIPLLLVLLVRIIRFHIARQIELHIAFQRRSLSVFRLLSVLKDEGVVVLKLSLLRQL